MSLALTPSANAQFGLFPDKGYWREQWQAPPLAVEIELPASLEDYVVDGKLQLSLSDYVELVMLNNPDINLQKLNVYEQQNQIQAAFSPFDPMLVGNFNANRANNPSNDILAGADVTTNLLQRANFGYQQMLTTGTSYEVNFTGVKNASNSAFRNFNPSITHTLGFNLSQPLLRGRGRSIQKIPVYIAESRLEFTEEIVRQRIINLLFQAENTYWNAINSRETLRVRENGLELARAFLERSKRELELGAISPLDIYQPEQQFATAQVIATQSSYRLEQSLNEVRRQIGADLHPDFRHLPVELTESVEPPAYTPTCEPEEQVA
jgi:outer membrane protein TolC